MTLDQALRAKLLAHLSQPCPTCRRRPSIAQVAREARVDYSSLHKFLRMKHRDIQPLTMARLTTWLKQR